MKGAQDEGRARVEAAGPNDPGLLAVEDAYARILAARHPRTSWASAHRAHPGPAGNLVVRLFPDEADDAPI